MDSCLVVYTEEKVYVPDLGPSRKKSKPFKLQNIIQISSEDHLKS